MQTTAENVIKMIRKWS